MMELNERVALLVDIVAKQPNIGKTALMKIPFLLQAIHKVPIDYSYEIYTYGPYCATVMSDIECAQMTDLISVNQIVYDNGMHGYQIRVKKQSKEYQDKHSDLLNRNAQSINDILDFFGNMTAKDLELYSTIVFLYCSHFKNHWDMSKKAVCNTVHDAKPHFSIDNIYFAYDKLEERGYLNKAIAS